MIINDKFSHKTKHIDTKYHFTEIILKYVETEHNIAGMFTKPLGPTKLKYIRDLAGLAELPASLRDGVES